MDDKGNIRRFASKEEAIAAGFPHDVPEFFAEKNMPTYDMAAVKRAALQRSMAALQRSMIEAASAEPAPPRKEKYPGQSTAYLKGANVT